MHSSRKLAEWEGPSATLCWVSITGAFIPGNEIQSGECQVLCFSQSQEGK